MWWSHCAECVHCWSYFFSYRALRNSGCREHWGYCRVQIPAPQELFWILCLHIFSWVIYKWENPFWSTPTYLVMVSLKALASLWCGDSMQQGNLDCTCLIWAELEIKSPYFLLYKIQLTIRSSPVPKLPLQATFAPQDARIFFGGEACLMVW